jgi:hypothetical protein
MSVALRKIRNHSKEDVWYDTNEGCSSTGLLGPKKDTDLGDHELSTYDQRLCEFTNLYLSSFLDLRHSTLSTSQ